MAVICWGIIRIFVVLRIRSFSLLWTIIGSLRLMATGRPRMAATIVCICVFVGLVPLGRGVL